MHCDTQERLPRSPGGHDSDRMGTGVAGGMQEVLSSCPQLRGECELTLPCPAACTPRFTKHSPPRCPWRERVVDECGFREARVFPAMMSEKQAHSRTQLVLGNPREQSKQLLPPESQGQVVRPQVGPRQSRGAHAPHEGMRGTGAGEGQ